MAERGIEIPVLIESVAGNGYRAREPFGLAAEGATPEEATRKLQEQMTIRVAAGAQIVPLSSLPAQHPWAPFAGMFKDDPLFDEWQQAIAEYRQQIEDDPNVP
jgi:hypothetical protein